MNYRRLIVFILAAYSPAVADDVVFDRDIQPLLKQYCFSCHNAVDRESGIQVDHLDGTFPDARLRLWEEIGHQVADAEMPPEGESQPDKAERKLLENWISKQLHIARNRERPNHGTIRRLTVSQYRNTLRDLLLLDENVTDILPPDALSKEGFRNNKDALLLSPRQMEAYFSIAEKSLAAVIVDEGSRPTIQRFTLELGRGINKEPCPDKLILGANSHLLPNSDFVVTEPLPTKPFEFEPFRMQTKYRFNEGYQGNATVRGWREYDSIYHAVFACMRGNNGYPKGLAYQTVPDGLLLRPAIPSAELFGVESTYGPKANFKISLRELPHHGNFRVTVRAAKYEDGLLLDRNIQPFAGDAADSIQVDDAGQPQQLHLAKAGVYQVDIHQQTELPEFAASDASKLHEELAGHWKFDNEPQSEKIQDHVHGRLMGDAKLVETPFGKGLQLDGKGDSLVVPRHSSMNVGAGDFSVSAWIHPTQLRQGGIVCLGKYSWTHGWYFDMPDNRGVLRIETVNPNNEPNGTIASRSGVVRKNQWQHVAAVVRRGPNNTVLYVNGYEVARGTVAATSLDNPKVDLHIGRIQDSKEFKGMIDDVRIHRRALSPAEIQALVEPGRKLTTPPPAERPRSVTLHLDNRSFTATPSSEAFLAVRLPAGEIPVHLEHTGSMKHRLAFSLLPAQSPVRTSFERFEKRSPRLGVHLGLRRDCGSTFAPVGTQPVEGTDLQDITFTGAINNYPSPDVQKDNDNYLAGIREIGVRSEYTVGDDVPRLLIHSVTFEGPYYESWPPKEHSNIFFSSDHRTDRPRYAREIIHTFASRAFRRPIQQHEEDAFFEVWQESFRTTKKFNQSIKDALLVVLTSPQFLMLIEQSSSPQAEDLSEFELASKLSYFLWNGPPDQRLLQLAADSKLRSSLDNEIDRLLNDDRSLQFVHEFASQWLSLEKFDVVETDRKQFPTLTRSVRSQLRQEPIHFLNYLIQQNRPATDLINSEFIMANDVVADYYGLETDQNSGFEFVPIQHQARHLGGILTQASVMAGLSDGREANPVKRGAWFARRIIAEPPSDPPPNVPAISEDEEHLSLREKLEKHRNQIGCQKCHESIDPWGLPFEQISAAGLFRAEKVDAEATLPDGTDVSGLNGLRNYLINDRIDQVAFSFLKHMSGYAVGRTLNYNEIEFLRKQGVELRQNGYRIRDMIRFVVNSPIFLKK